MLTHAKLGIFHFLKCISFLNRERFQKNFFGTLTKSVIYAFRHIARSSVRFLTYREICLCNVIFIHLIGQFTVHQAYRSYIY